MSPCHLHLVVRKPLHLDCESAGKTGIPSRPVPKLEASVDASQGKKRNQNKDDTEEHGQNAVPPQLPLALPDPLLD